MSCLSIKAITKTSTFKDVARRFAKLTVSLDPFTGIETLASFSQGSDIILLHIKRLSKHMGMSASLQMAQFILAVPQSFYVDIWELLFSHPKVGLDWSKGGRRLVGLVPSLSKMGLGHNSSIQWHLKFQGITHRIITILDRSRFLMMDPTIGEVPPFSIGWEMQIRAVSCQERGRRSKSEQRWKDLQAWARHLGKAVSVRCHLLQFLEVFTFRSSIDVQVQLGSCVYFRCDTWIQESILWSLVAQGLVSSTW